MTENLEQIFPYFSTIEPNKKISLYQGSLDIIRQNSTKNVTGKIYLDWLPSPRIKIEYQNLNIDVEEFNQTF